MVHLEVASSLSALGEPRAVERILIALLEASLRWGDPERPVLVSAMRAGPSVVITVLAEGTPWQDSRPRLFEPFVVRGEGTSGLELAIAQRLARALDGEVGAGNGGLWLRLPASSSTSACARRPGSTAPARSHARPCARGR